MEYDRFQKNSTLFIIGLIALLLSLSLFAFSFYILPFLLFGWVYDVPEFVSVWREWLKLEYHFTHVAASWIILLTFIIPALICGYISYFASNYIDNRIYNVVNREDLIVSRRRQNYAQDSRVLLLKILSLAILIIIIITLLQWFISIPPRAF